GPTRSASRRRSTGRRGSTCRWCGSTMNSSASACRSRPWGWRGSMSRVTSRRCSMASPSSWRARYRSRSNSRRAATAPRVSKASGRGSRSTTRPCTASDGWTRPRQSARLPRASIPTTSWCIRPCRVPEPTRPRTGSKRRGRSSSWSSRSSAKISARPRAMARICLARLRLVNPRDGWPNIHAHRAASGADRILEAAALFDTLEAAIADCTLVLATTARAHDQAKPVIGPDAAAALLAPHVAAGESVAVLFGRERYGLENHEVALADRIVTFPVNPAFASLNLAQAVAVVAYEWFKLASGGVLPFVMPQKSEPAGKQQLQAFFANLERQLGEIEYFRPLDKRATMLVNLRNIFARMQPTQQDIQ